MNNFEKIKYLRKLKTKRETLTKELADINMDIELQEESCFHILVNLGSKGIINDYERCLLCGKQAEEGYALTSECCVDAKDYLLNYNINDEGECTEKFDNIQTLALGLLRENPNMTREELTTKLNNLIQESISFREEQKASKLVKTRNFNNIK